MSTSVAAEQISNVEENVNMKTEPKTGVSFPVILDDGKELNALGLRKKKVFPLNFKIYAFGMYADNTKLKELFASKIKKPLAEPTKELYELVINSDIGVMVRLVIVFGGLTMSMVRKNFDEGLGGSLYKINGGKNNENDELITKVMESAEESMKLPPGSVIEISRLPGYILQTKVKGDIVSVVESEPLCRAYINMYLGDDAFDPKAKEMFGKSLISLF